MQFKSRITLFKVIKSIWYNIPVKIFQRLALGMVNRVKAKWILDEILKDQTGIKDSPEIDALRRAAFEPWVQNRFSDLRELGLREKRGRRIGAHPARVQATVTI